MKFSQRWLREWVNPAIDTQQLAQRVGSVLTCAGGGGIDAVTLREIQQAVIFVAGLCVPVEG